MEQLNDKIQDHEYRIVVLEGSDREMREKVLLLERNIHQLENTVIQESRETRSVLQGTMDKQWDLIKARDDAASREKERQHEIQKTKMERYTEVFLKVSGAGGILYLIVQIVVDVVSK